jgi:hypothetical protein
LERAAYRSKYATIKKDGDSVRNMQMDWDQVRKQYPEQWLVIEAIDAHSEGNIRRVEKVSIISDCEDGRQALHVYQEMHRQHPEREFYFVHTSRVELCIEERHWIGIRGLQSNHEACVKLSM